MIRTSLPFNFSRTYTKNGVRTLLLLNECPWCLCHRKANLMLTNDYIIRKLMNMHCSFCTDVGKGNKNCKQLSRYFLWVKVWTRKCKYLLFSVSHILNWKYSTIAIVCGRIIDGKNSRRKKIILRLDVCLGEKIVLATLKKGFNSAKH